MMSFDRLIDNLISQYCVHGYFLSSPLARSLFGLREGLTVLKAPFFNALRL